ncbi:hypothetical protein GQ457_13G014690 [Hibiscus cannabinus]
MNPSPWPEQLFAVVIDQPLSDIGSTCRRNQHGHENALDAVVSPHRRRHSSGDLGQARPPFESSHRTLSLLSLSFPRRDPRLHEDGLEATAVDGSDLPSTPLDRPGFEICQPQVPSPPSDRWDSPLEAPIADDRVTEMGMVNQRGRKWFRAIVELSVLTRWVLS